MTTILILAYAAAPITLGLIIALALRWRFRKRRTVLAVGQTYKGRRYMGHEDGGEDYTNEN